MPVAVQPAARSIPASAMPRAPMNDCSIRYEITERCERTAALGRPVVPLVKMRMNGSSSAMGDSGSFAVVASASPAKSCSVTSVGTPGSPSSRARRFSSITSSFGSVSSSALRISAPVHHPFMATRTASRLATAQKVRIHSRQLAAHTATRSPGPMSYPSCSPHASDPTKGTSSSKWMRVPSPNT